MRSRLPRLAAALLALLLLAACGPTEASPFEADAEHPLLICLDPGHGGADAGALGPGEGHYEKDDNLALALAVRKLLESSDAPVRVMMTREDDSALTLDARSQAANAGKAGIFVSFHRNSGGGQGVEVFIKSTADRHEKRLGAAVMDALAGTEISRARGLKQGTAANPAVDYAVIREAAMPACLIELGFIDSEGDNALFTAHLEAYAEAIAQGLISLIEAP